MNYADDRDWSDKYIPAIRDIVGPRLLVPSPFERDVNEATDLMVFRARDMRIAARIRRHAADRYPYQFTIRSARVSGVKTELAKIIEGWGDWLFYGHASIEDDGAISDWLLIDLDKLRRVFANHSNTVKPPFLGGCGRVNNFGGRTSFLWFDVRRLPENVLIDSQWQTPERKKNAA
jgi:hypothetical protein